MDFLIFGQIEGSGVTFMEPKLKNMDTPVDAWRLYYALTHCFDSSQQFHTPVATLRIVKPSEINILTCNLYFKNKTIFLKFNEIDGSPDGMTTDIRNNLWVCHYRGASISVYDLRGNKIHQINLPAKNITNCTFGGSSNNELFISTARKGMKAKEIKKYPLSGSLFKVKTNLKGKKTISFKSAILAS